MQDHERRLPFGGNGQLTRRTLIARGAQGAAALAAGKFLISCGGDDDETSSSPTGATTPVSSGSTAAEAPKRGGTLTAGMVGVGASETVSPALAVAISDLARVYSLYDRFFDVGPDVETLEPRLATSAEHDGTAKVWTLELREGVTFHNGKAFTADDAIYSLRALADPAHFGHGLLAGIVDFDNIRARDGLTIEVPLLVAHNQLPALLTGYNVCVFPDGTTTEQLATSPIGSGPFSFTSFTAGQESVFDANPSYWEEGKPFVDRLVINSTFTDIVAQVNALRSNQINVLPQLPFGQINELKSSGAATILRSNAPSAQYMKMRVDSGGPLADQRVRLALQLLADRQQLVDVALSGFGTVGNDLVARGTKFFADDLVRERDVDRAKSLLQKAGFEDLSLSIMCGLAFAGSVESATLFAEQVKEAGVNLKVNQVDIAEYSTAYVPEPFASAYTVTVPSLDYFYRSFMATTAGYPETGWGTKKRDAAVMAAIAETDDAVAGEMWHDIQQEWFEGGSYLVWGYADYVDAVSNDVKGLQTTAANNLNNFRFQDGWIDA